VKLDENGNITWSKCYGGSSVEEPFSVQQTNDGGFIIAGLASSDDGDVTGNHQDIYGPTYDYWITKVDASGNLLWQKSLGGSGEETASEIRELPGGGGFIVFGYSDSNDGDVSDNHGYEDYWVAKTDTAGNLLWQKTFGGSNFENATALELLPDGGFILAGGTNSNDVDVSGNNSTNLRLDYWVIRLDIDGNLLWQKCLGGTMDEYANAISPTPDGGFIIAGDGYSNDGDISGNHGFSDYWIVKLAPEAGTGIAQPRSAFFSVYPNPAQSEVSISLVQPAALVTVQVYDLQGRLQKQKSFANGLANPFKLSIESLAEGLYTIRIINDSTGMEQWQKLVKNK
jgi:hypothetical protein